MDKTRKNSLAFSLKFIYLLFCGFLAGLFTLTVNATELAGTASKIDSGYYDGSYGKGAYWVTRGLYSSIFTSGDKSVDANDTKSIIDKLPGKKHENTKNPVKYFIYSYYGPEHANGFFILRDNLIQSEKKHKGQKVKLSRKTYLKISWGKQLKNIVQV